MTNKITKINRNTSKKFTVNRTVLQADSATIGRNLM